jgi:hypothetical protein
MRLEPGCPRCAAVVTRSGSAWRCPTHEAITPLWRAVEPDYDAFAEHLVLSRPLPTWLPWPMPDGWHVTDFGVVAVEGCAPQAAYVTCSGPSELDGVVELTVITEEPGVGLAARCGGVPHTDPGRDAGVGTPPTRIRVENATVPMWLVSTEDGPAALERGVLAGEAGGRWIWLVVRPASAVLLLQEIGALRDISVLGPQLVTLPFARVPRAW